MVSIHTSNFFWRSGPLKTRPNFQPKEGSFGFQVCIHIYDMYPSKDQLFDLPLPSGPQVIRMTVVGSGWEKAMDRWWKGVSTLWQPLPMMGTHGNGEPFSSDKPFFGILRDMHWLVDQIIKYWVVVSNIFLCSPRSLSKWSNLTSIFFKWVGSTTN